MARLTTVSARRQRWDRVFTGWQQSEAPAPIHHQPEIVRRADGQWEVRCPECAIAGEAPVGICLPIRAYEEAVNLRDNHRARVPHAV